jgi:hypothetical protein
MLIPRLEVVVVTLVLIAAQTQMPRFQSVRSPTESSSSSGSNSAIVFRSSAARSRNIMNSSGVAVANEQQEYS